MENSKTKILIVEDDEMVRSFVTIHLENHGFEIVGVATGKALFAELEKQTYELIILDLNLPDGDGLEFAGELRKTDNTPILIASARKGMDDRLTALNLGFIDYVTKPFDPQELYLRIKNLLNAPENVEGQSIDQSSKNILPILNKPSQFKTAALGGIAATILIAAAVGMWYWGKSTTETASMQPPPATPNVAPAPATKPQPEPTPSPPQVTQPIPEPKPKAIIEKPVKCAKIPDVTWWSNKSHEAIRLYVQRKYAGDWTPYKKSWDRRLEKLVDILGRDSSAVASSGIVLAGPELEEYIAKVETRISVIDCLSKSAVR